MVAAVKPITSTQILTKLKLGYAKILQTKVVDISIFFQTKNE